MFSLREYLGDVEIHSKECRQRFGGLEAPSGPRVVHTPVSLGAMRSASPVSNNKCYRVVFSDMLQVPQADGPDMELLLQVDGESHRHSAADYV